MEFINGIEVLDQVVVEETIFQWGTIPAILICLGMITVLLGVVFSITECEFAIFLLGLIGGTIFFVWTWLAGGETVDTDRYEYKVTINEQVTLEEFNDRYEIVKQEGKIYTIRIRDDG